MSKKFLLMTMCPVIVRTRQSFLMNEVETLNQCIGFYHEHLLLPSVLLQIKGTLKREKI